MMISTRLRSIKSMLGAFACGRKLHRKKQENYAFMVETLSKDDTNPKWPSQCLTWP